VPRSPCSSCSAIGGSTGDGGRASSRRVGVMEATDVVLGRGLMLSDTLLGRARSTSFSMTMLAGRYRGELGPPLRAGDTWYRDSLTSVSSVPWSCGFSRCVARYVGWSDMSSASGIFRSRRYRVEWRFSAWRSTPAKRARGSGDDEGVLRSGRYGLAFLRPWDCGLAWSCFFSR
jgi:hypothetical protein